MLNDLKKIHAILLQNVKEENEKESKELSNQLFDLNSNNDLFSMAKRSLKFNRFKFNNDGIPIKITKPIVLKKCVGTQKKEGDETKKDTIFSDKQYLNYVMKDLKIISHSIKKKQKLFYSMYTSKFTTLPKISLNNQFKIKNSDSFRTSKLNHIYMKNLKMSNYRLSFLNLLSPKKSPPVDVNLF